MDKHIKPGEGSMKAISFAEVFNNMTQPMTIAEPEKPNNLIYVNDAYCKLVGYSQGELIGKNPGFLQGGEYTKQRSLMREALNNYRPINVLVLNYKKDGTRFWNELHIHPVIIDGKCTFYVGMARDVTEQIRKNVAEIDGVVSLVKEFKDKTLEETQKLTETNRSLIKLLEL